MCRAFKLLALTPLVAVAAARAAVASPPLPQFSEVDPCIVACPAGDSLFRVVARHYWTIPSAHAWVQIDLCGCPELRVEPNESSPYLISGGCLVGMTADAQGVGDFRWRAGGLCSGASIPVYADGVLLATRQAVACFDRDGDLVVEQSDLATLRSKIGSADPTADFDCDGMVTETDAMIAETHLGHTLPAPVGVPGGPGPAVASLAQNRPNPFGGTSRIFFLLERPERVTLQVFDVRGRELATLLRDAAMGAGPHQVSFDARGLSTGIYLYRLQAGDFVATRRMAVLR